MGDHLIEGEFQSDKYPTTQRGKVPLSVRDSTAQDLLYAYALRHRKVDAQFSDDLIAALRSAGYDPLAPGSPRGGDTPGHVFFYERDYYCLSNFSAFRLTWQGVDYDTSEHAYQASKFPGCPEAQEEIRAARSAHVAFKLARAVWPTAVRPDWPLVRVGVMREILRAKALQHPYVCRKLGKTGERVLVEDSWRDDFWGWGERGDGQNMLGRLWMEIRAELAR
jgi:ribA/ribD-fused uncharacterized protein